jgi:integrase
MFDHGVPVHVVSRRLGHTSVATTADIYVARMPSADRAAADTWATVLRAAEQVHDKA